MKYFKQCECGHGEVLMSMDEEDAAEYLGATVEQFKGWVADGTLYADYYRVGDRWMASYLKEMKKRLPAILAPRLGYRLDMPVEASTTPA
jgi:hypothetical protein